MGKTLTRHFNNIVTQVKIVSLLTLGYFTQKALSNHIAGESYRMGGMVCFDWVLGYAVLRKLLNEHLCFLWSD